MPDQCGFIGSFDLIRVTLDHWSWPGSSQRNVPLVGRSYQLHHHVVLWMLVGWMLGFVLWCIGVPYPERGSNGRDDCLSDGHWTWMRYCPPLLTQVYKCALVNYERDTLIHGSYKNSCWKLRKNRQQQTAGSIVSWWLMTLTLYPEVYVQVLGFVIYRQLCFWARCLTLAVPLSSKQQDVVARGNAEDLRWRSIPFQLSLKLSITTSYFMSDTTRSGS